MCAEELKKSVRTFDLAVAAGRKRQSARTGFIHESEVIPIYENFCFALALFRQKTTDSVMEGKKLIDRLLAFQAPDGNFPRSLHDFPHCLDRYMPLKIAPILIYLQRFFGSILGEQKGNIEEALRKTLSRRIPEWENRDRACRGELLLPVDSTHFSAEEWTEWLITAQLAGQTHFSIPYDEGLQMLRLPSQFEVQEKGEPRPNPVEWLLADGQFSSRLLRDHPHQLLCAPLFPISFQTQPIANFAFRLFWKGAKIHSLVASSLCFDLPEGVEMGRNDLFEAAMFCDISPETELFVEGRKATVFRLGDRIAIRTPSLTVQLQFILTEGSGDFCGHIFPANRPLQICKGTESYDWQIALRTLRRSKCAQIQIALSYN